MRVPSALFALLPLLGQLTQAHHDAALRSFKLNVRTPQRSDFLSLDGSVDVALVKRAVKQRHLRRQAQAVTAARDRTAHMSILKRAQEMEDMFHAKKARAVGRALKSGSVNVVSHGEGFWSGMVGVGPDGLQQITNLVLDTEGPKLSIYAKGSPTECKTTYDPTKSPHAIKGAAYTSGDGIAKGDYYQDTVTFAGFEVVNQSLVAFTSTSNGENLEDHMALMVGACGWLGLGFNSIHSTLVQTLINSNAIAQPFFAVGLKDNGGSVDIGAVDTRAYNGHVKWARLVNGSTSTSWTIQTTAFTNYGKPVKNNGIMTVNFQTWLPFTVIPDWLGTIIFNNMNVTHDEDNGSLYQVACNKIEDRTFGFIIDGQKMEIALSSLNIGSYSEDPKQCGLAILPGGDIIDEMMLGSLALESLYVVHAFAHDKMGPAIGVAQAKTLPQPPQ